MYPAKTTLNCLMSWRVGREDVIPHRRETVAENNIDFPTGCLGQQNVTVACLSYVYLALIKEEVVLLTFALISCYTHVWCRSINMESKRRTRS